jgi:hypothetical protein
VPEPSPPGSTSRGLLIAAGLLVVAAGFGLGFRLGTGGDGQATTPVGEQAAPRAVGDDASPASEAPSSSGATEASSSSTTTTTAATTTSTAAPTTTTTTPPTTAPTTVAPPTVVATVPAPPTTSGRADIVVTYPRTAAGYLALPRQGSTAITLTNQGTLPGGWLLSGVGFVSGTGGTAQGTVQPGASTVVTLAAAPGQPVGSTLNILVLGAGTGTQAVPALVV